MSGLRGEDRRLAKEGKNPKVSVFFLDTGKNYVMFNVILMSS